jgi:hypothetical protein
MSEKAPATPDYAYRSDINYLNQRMASLETKVRLLVRMLLDKKILGEEAAKTFMETKTDSERTAEIVEYYRKKKTS